MSLASLAAKARMQSLSKSLNHQTIMDVSISVPASRVILGVSYKKGLPNEKRN
jgi:hypothetical protein